MNLMRLNQAEIEYAEAIRLRPVYPLARSNRCSALTDLGRLSEAEFECRMAIKQSPEYAPPYLNLALIKLKFDDWLSARQLFQRALALAPNSFPVRSFYAKALSEHGEIAEADKHWQYLHLAYPQNSVLSN